MKKLQAAALAVLLVALFLCAPALAEGRVQVVATIFPIYDWVRNLIGPDNDQVELTLLLDSGVDLHSFQPTVQDIARIAQCDLFLYVGGESDEWVADVLREAGPDGPLTLSLLDALGDAAKVEETVEGMESEDEEEDEDEAPEYDEHVWLSLRNAQVLCGALAEALTQVDAAHAADYAANLSDYSKQLADLDAAYTEMTAAAARHTVLFADRFPFRYLADDYGLSYYAAFSGCAAETEASFQTVIFLAQKVDELALPAVLTIEGTQHHLAETVVAATTARDQAILTMNSLQGITAQEVAAGASYLRLMEENLEVLKLSLN